MTALTYATEPGLNAGPARPGERPFADHLAEGYRTVDAMTPAGVDLNPYRRDEMAGKYAAISQTFDRVSVKTARRADVARAAA